jgi:signal transduction histidine kinase
MGQQMTALRMNLAALRSGAAKVAGWEAQVERTLALAEDLDRSVDFLVWELRPASLDHLGLSPALRGLVDGWAERSNIHTAYRARNVKGLRFSPDIENNLYHLAQEALHNVHKHSGAKNAGVFFEYRDGKAILIIEDDGRGFDPDAISDETDKGMGLVSMRERAALIGGTVEIESSPEAGTTIYVRVPATPVTR